MADDDLEDLELFGDAILNIEPSAGVQKFTTGKAVLEYLSNQPDDQLPCLMVLDYNMPEQNGAEVLAQICRDTRYDSISKVILSTSSSPSHMRECLESGATDYFVKPNNMKEVDEVARKMLSYCQIKS